MDNDIKVTDILAIVSRGGLGAIPILGPLAAEIIGGIIPNQRIDRLVDTVRRLEAILGDDGKKLFKEKMADPEFIDLFEEALLQAARAQTEERRKLLATMIMNGIQMDCHAHDIKKRLLETVRRINDKEVLLLYSYTLPYEGFCDFWKQYAVKRGNSFYLVVEDGSESSEKIGAMVSYMQNLSMLGLLRMNNRVIFSHNNVTELDLGPWSITQFGLMLLAFAGVIR